LSDALGNEFVSVRKWCNKEAQSASDKIKRKLVVLKKQIGHVDWLEPDKTICLPSTDVTNPAGGSKVISVKKKAIQLFLHNKFPFKREKLSNTSARVRRQFDFALVQDVVEGRPAAPAVVFGLWTEQWLLANDANVSTRVVGLVVAPCEGALGAFFLRDVVLNGGEPRLQLGFVHPVRHPDDWRSAKRKSVSKTRMRA
jgi:hypothetical protein